MANFGIGLGAFADGFARGIGLGRQMKRNKREDQQFEREDNLRQSFADARKDYDSTVADNVLTQAGQADPNQPFDAAQATKQAEQKIGSFADFVYKQQLPKIIDTAIASGDLATADALQKWGQDKQERKRTELFGSALNDFYAGQASGDYTAFADKAMKLLNDGGYGQMQATGYEFVKDGDGNTTGVTFNLKDGDKEYSHTFNSMQDVGQFLAAQADPRAAVQRFAAQSASADEFKSKIGMKQAEAQIGLSADLALEDAKHSNRLQIEAAKAKTDTGAEAKMNMLLAAGHPRERVNRWLPQLLGIRDEERQRMSSDDVIKFAYDTLSKDFEYQDAPPEVKQKMVDDFIAAFRTRSDSLASDRNPKPVPGLSGSTPR